MREIGVIPGEKQAHLFEDHLLARKITSKVVSGKDGWSIWVHHEDNVPEATAELEAFLREPDAERFRESVRIAQALRKEHDEAERLHRKNTRDFRERWEGSAWSKYPLTMAMIILTVLVGIATSVGQDRRSTIFRSMVFTGYSRIDQVDPFGVTIRGPIVSNQMSEIKSGQVWRLITPIFLHFGFPHLIFNMMFLRSFGGMIEFRKGTLRFALLVLVSAILSNVGQYIDQSYHEELGVFGGMSGVGYALFGYLWMKGQTRPDERLGVNSNTVITMIAWFVLCMTGWIGPIANTAHGVGLVVGMLFGLTRF